MRDGRMNKHQVLERLAGKINDLTHEVPEWEDITATIVEPDPSVKNDGERTALMILGINVAGMVRYIAEGSGGFASRPTGKFRLVVGDYGNRVQFPEKADGSHSWDKAARHLVLTARTWAKNNAFQDVRLSLEQEIRETVANWGLEDKAKRAGVSIHAYAAQEGARAVVRWRVTKEGQNTSLGEAMRDFADALSCHMPASDTEVIVQVEDNETTFRSIDQAKLAEIAFSDQSVRDKEIRFKNESESLMRPSDYVLVPDDEESWQDLRDAMTE